MMLRKIFQKKRKKKTGKKRKKESRLSGGRGGLSRFFDEIRPGRVEILSKTRRA